MMILRATSILGGQKEDNGMICSIPQNEAIKDAIKQKSYLSIRFGKTPGCSNAILFPFLSFFFFFFFFCLNLYLFVILFSHLHCTLNTLF
jgi:hypothetical protein